MTGVLTLPARITAFLFDLEGVITRTVRGLARRKNELVQEVLARDGVTTYEGSGSVLAVAVLRAAGLSDTFTVTVDGAAGVAAGRAGRFGLVLGVDRSGQRAHLQAAGADIVVADLGELVRAR